MQQNRIIVLEQLFPYTGIVIPTDPPDGGEWRNLHGDKQNVDPSTSLGMTFLRFVIQSMNRKLPPGEGGSTREHHHQNAIPRLTPELQDLFDQLIKEILPHSIPKELRDIDLPADLKQVLGPIFLPPMTGVSAAQEEERRKEYAHRLIAFGDSIGNALTQPKNYTDAYNMLLELASLTAKGSFPEGREGFIRAMRLGHDALTVRMRSKKTNSREKHLTLQMLNAYIMEGEDQDAEHGIRALLSCRAQLHEWMRKDFLSSENTVFALHAIIERGTEKEIDELRALMRDVLRDPKLDMRSIAQTAAFPWSKIDVAVPFTAQIMTLMIESLGLPASLINRWKKSEESKALGVWYNIKTLIAIEQKARGSSKALHRDFGIRYFGRYPAPVLLRQFEETSVQQPYGIMVYPGVEDSRGVFYQDTKIISQFDDSLRKGLYAGTPLGLRIMEAQNKDEVERRIPLIDSKYGEQNPISFAVISGHGNAGMLLLGEGEPSDTYEPRDFEKEPFKEGKRYFEKGATFILFSCRTGILLAQRFSRAHPDTFVYASLVNTHMERIDRVAERPGDEPLLLPTYGKGDVWILYRGGKCIGYNAEGEIEETLTDKKQQEITETCEAIGESRRPGFPLRRIEQTVFTKRLRFYGKLLQTVIDRGEKSASEVLPYMNRIAGAAVHHLPQARRAAAGMLKRHLKEMSHTASDTTKNEFTRDMALSCLAYYAHCAKGGDQEEGMRLLDKFWDAMEKRITLLEGPAAIVARFLAAQLQHGDEHAVARVRECIDNLFKEIADANSNLSDEFPKNRTMAFVAELAAALLSHHQKDTQQYAREIIQRLFHGFTEQDTMLAVDAWIHAQGDVSDRMEMIKRHLAAAVKLENRHEGSVHSLFSEWGIRNFGNYPTDTLREQYVEGRESRLPHALILYPQKSIAAWKEVRDHYLMLWHQLEESFKRKGVRIRIAEWGEASDIEQHIGADGEHQRNRQLVIIGSRGDSRNMLYKKGNRWMSISEHTLRRKEGRSLFAALHGKSVILDVPCTGKWKRFAQEFSAQEGCTVTAPLDSSRLSVIKPTLFYPNTIAYDVTYGPAGHATYRDGEIMKGAPSAP
ncbi:hypothetical protein HY622_01275 [Candidatus Uhrbacteria bacterium]|nr:hypothetical protein [Candidatus Uhrbacteria bacterium]